MIPRYKVNPVDGDRCQEWHVEDILNPVTVTRDDGTVVTLSCYETVCVCYEPEMAEYIADLLNRNQNV